MPHRRVPRRTSAFWTGQYYVPWHLVITVLSEAFDAIKVQGEPFFITVFDGTTKKVASVEETLAMPVTVLRPNLWAPTPTASAAVAASTAASNALVQAATFPPPPAPASPPDKRLRDELDAALAEIKRLKGEVPQE